MGRVLDWQGSSILEDFRIPDLEKVARMDMFKIMSNATLAQSSATCPKIVHSTKCKKSSPEIHETRPNFKTFPAHCAVIPAKNQVMFLKTARFKMADTQKTKKMGDFQSTIFRQRSEEHRLNSSHITISYAVFCLKKKKKTQTKKKKIQKKKK